MGVWERLSSAVQEGRLVAGVRRRFRESVLREHFYRRALKLPHPPRRHTLPCISHQGSFSALPESILLKNSLDRAVADIGGPPDFIRAIEGMAGQKYRTFINTLVGSHPDARYLEIGSWKGSTAAAALYGNSVKALCIDNWSQFGGPRSAFLANMERVRSPAVDLRLVEDDFRRVDYTSIGRFNIFFFDGPHDELDLYNAVMLARPALDQSFVLIVDDWNWRQVRLGIFRGVRDAGYSIVSSIEILTTPTYSRTTSNISDWHNGYFIAAVDKGSGRAATGSPLSTAAEH